MNIKKLVLSFRGIDPLILADNALKQGKEHTRIWFLYACYRNLVKLGLPIKGIISKIEALNPFIEVIE